jgi:protoheme IX farnesyltransferase
MLLFLIIFLWTPPHFWALALYRSDDYARARVPMLPVIAGPDATRLQILLYALVLVAIVIAAWPLGYFGPGYGTVAIIAGAGLLWLAVNVYREREGVAAVRAARRLFGFSILYLFALFATLLIEAMLPVLGRMVG